MHDIRAYAAAVGDKPLARCHETVGLKLALGVCMKDDEATVLYDFTEEEVKQSNKLFGFGGVGLFFRGPSDRVAKLVRDTYRGLSEEQRRAVATLLDLTAEQRLDRELSVLGAEAGDPPPSGGAKPDVLPKHRPWREQARSLRYELGLLRDKLRDSGARCEHLLESRKRLKREVGRLRRRLRGAENAEAAIGKVRKGIRKVLLAVHPDKASDGQVPAHELTIRLTELLGLCAALP